MGWKVGFVLFVFFNSNNSNAHFGSHLLHPFTLCLQRIKEFKLYLLISYENYVLSASFVARLSALVCFVCIFFFNLAGKRFTVGGGGL